MEAGVGACRAYEEETRAPRSLPAATPRLRRCEVRKILRNEKQAQCDGLLPLLRDEQATRSETNERVDVEGRRVRGVCVFRCHKSQPACSVRKETELLDAREDCPAALRREDGLPC